MLDLAIGQAAGDIGDGVGRDGRPQPAAHSAEPIEIVLMNDRTGASNGMPGLQIVPGHPEAVAVRWCANCMSVSIPASHIPDCQLKPAWPPPSAP